MKKTICILLSALLLGVQAAAAAKSFTDVSESDWHYPYIQAMVKKDLVSGYDDGTFQPSGTLTQGEFLTLAARTFYPGTLAKSEGGRHWATNAYNAALASGILWADEFLEIDADSLGAPMDRKTVCVLLERIMTVVCKAPTLDASGFSADIADYAEIKKQYKSGVLQCYARGIVGGYTDGYFRPDRTLTRAEMCVILTRAAGLSVQSKPQPTPNWYTKGDNADKRIRIFGTDAVNKYENKAAAEQNIVEVVVPVWRLNRTTGEKTASKKYLQINRALAEDVVQIFNEIFNDPTQFPIYDLGGYSWRGDINNSEHNSGLAIDINPKENYQIYPNGTIGAGEYWKPGEDPHSIEEDGIVVQTFEKYGFSWGGNSWKSNKDYMHFSYLGR